MRVFVFSTLFFFIVLGGCSPIGPMPRLGCGPLKSEPWLAGSTSPHSPPPASMPMYGCSHPIIGAESAGSCCRIIGVRPWKPEVPAGLSTSVARQPGTAAPGHADYRVRYPTRSLNAVLSVWR